MNYASAERNFTRLKSWLGFQGRPKKKNDPEFQKIFRAMSAEQKLTLIQPQLTFYADSITRKTETLPMVATLAAGLLVLATLNKDLIPLTDIEVNTLLSLLLLLIPSTLHLYLWQMEETALNSLDNVGAYQESHPAERMPQVTFWAQLISDFPKLLAYVLYGVIFFLLFKIWGPAPVDFDLTETQSLKIIGVISVSEFGADDL